MATDLTLEDAAEKFDLITAYSSWDLQTKAEREQAEQDAADAEEQRKAEEEKAADEAEEGDEEPEAKATPAKTAASYSSGKSGK